jgi:sigma-B regulation protein RsbU (phosphoserine phosphatase)
MGPLIRRAGGRIEVVGQDRSGPPLGVVDDQAYEAVTAKLAPGDVVVLYTDGLTDALSPDGERFGSDRLERCLATVPPGATSVGLAIQSAVRSHTAVRDSFDDLTLICLGRS